MAASTPTPSLSLHERTRVEDYLNDKIQVSADFESLDSLLSSLRAQHDLQRKQVGTDICSILVFSFFFFF